MIIIVKTLIIMIMTIIIFYQKVYVTICGF